MHRSSFGMLFVLVFSTLYVSFVSNQAFAMGDAPSTCNNRYDGTISSLIISGGGQMYDPIANPGLTIQIDNDKSYSATFTIHTSSQSTQNNSLEGTTWYHTSALGYWMGTCLDGAGPDRDLTITSEFSHPSNMAPEITQTVSWATLTSSEITYNIQWVNPVNTATVPDTPTGLMAKAVSSSKISLTWSAPASDGGSQIISYTVERSGDSGSTWSAIANTSSTAYSDSGLARNTAYMYRVYATNSVGTSEPSNVSSAKTFLVGPLVGTIKIGPLNSNSPKLQISLGH
ncbi:MAG: fibronectin type III domain-containing protein [Thaumarchaeota archaeon]|nr:fibronectin type III domain-containing protein [Nitrososphaerota archaeon]